VPIDNESNVEGKTPTRTYWTKKKIAGHRPIILFPKKWISTDNAISPDRYKEETNKPKNKMNEEIVERTVMRYGPVEPASNRYKYKRK